MLSDSLAVILVRTRFPENIGMAARACANMGCSEICLVAPERWDPLKAEPTATTQGMRLVNRIRLYPDLAAAVSSFSAAYATTARLGGWRKGARSPEEAAKEIVARIQAGEKIALVFGSEDRGLTNEELANCQGLITIPVEESAASLNLAQAVLLTLYECRKALKGKKPAKDPGKMGISCGELQLLERKLKQALVLLECFGEENQDYFFQQWHELLSRSRLKRHEFDALMGVCRQILNRISL